MIGTLIYEGKPTKILFEGIVDQGWQTKKYESRVQCST